MKLTGVAPLYNVLSADYPYLECLISYMPLLDELIINDGGCDDGTIKYIKKLRDNVFPDIEIIKIPHSKGKNWESMDKALEEIINDLDTDWIVEIQADEFINPKDYHRYKDILNKANSEGYNSLRQVRKNIADWSRESYYDYKIIRFFRKTDRYIRSNWGGDCFYYKGGKSTREGFTTHNLPNEFDVEGTILFHVQDAFPESKVKQLKRHVEIYAKGHEGRIKSYKKAKKLMANKNSYSKINVEDIHPKIPELFHGLVNMNTYEVRDELFDKDWLKSKGINP